MFWQVFIFVCNLLIPALMLILGWMMYKHTPKEINDIYGYRTTMSRMNKDTWNFANKYCGKLWIKIGIIMLIISLIIQFLFINSNDYIITIISCMLCIIQAIVVIFSIIPVEKELKKNFDEKGAKKHDGG